MPGTFLSNNYIVTYEAGSLTVTPASLSVSTSANPTEIIYGNVAPEYSSALEGFETSTTFFEEGNTEAVTLSRVIWNLLWRLLPSSCNERRKRQGLPGDGADFHRIIQHDSRS
ncbi:MAG: hypothetical protein U5K54_01450 [Cytophagales bacterium]|nr:hypothetical protein [Cytophagales bacterium]